MTQAPPEQTPLGQLVEVEIIWKLVALSQVYSLTEEGVSQTSFTVTDPPIETEPLIVISAPSESVHTVVKGEVVRQAPSRHPLGQVDLTI